MPGHTKKPPTAKIISPGHGPTAAYDGQRSAAIEIFEIEQLCLGGAKVREESSKLMALLNALRSFSDYNTANAGLSVESLASQLKIERSFAAG